MEHIRFHRPLRDSEKYGDFSLRKPFRIKHHHRNPLPFRQRGEGGAKSLAQVQISDGSCRIVPGSR